MGPASLCQWCFFDCGGRRQRATQAASSASRAVASVRKLGKRRIGEPGCRLCLLSTPGRFYARLGRRASPGDGAPISKKKYPYSGCLEREKPSSPS